jgi:uncharacterized protein YceK
MRNLIATLSLFNLLCSGCGTIAGHDDQGTMGGVNHGVYRGVRSDCQWIAHPEPETILALPLVYIDLPFSFAADTLCLPFDTIAVMEKPEAEKPQEK